MIAASVGGLPSLADIPEFEAIAGAIGEVGGYSVVISTQSNSLAATDLNDFVTGEYGEEAMAALRASGILHPYLLLAVGIGQDAGDVYSVLLYINPDPGSAQANAIILDSILAEGVSLHHGDAWSNHVDRFEVTVSGRVTRAKIWSSDPTLGLSAYSNLDSLVLSE